MTRAPLPFRSHPPRTRFWTLKAQRLGLPDAKSAMKAHMEELAREGKVEGAARTAFLLLAGDMPGLVGRGNRANNISAFPELLPEHKLRAPRRLSGSAKKKGPTAPPVQTIRRPAYRRRQKPLLIELEPETE